MKRVTRNGVIAVAAASGAMAVAGSAFADSAADGAAAGSPGLISGNSIQLPVHVPVNVCGNTVNVVGLLNPAAGNTCANEGGGAGGGAASTGGASAHSDEEDSPGVLSGNGVQLPVHVPVNVSGNSVNVGGIGNPSQGNHSDNTSGGHSASPTPEPSAQPTPPVTRSVPPQAPSALAHTGTDVAVPAAAGGAALMVTGTALYRRFRPRPKR